MTKQPKNTYDIKLDDYEQDIVDNFDSHVELTPKEKQRKISNLIEAAKNYNKGSTRISIPNADLAKLKNKASQLGVSYKNYIIEALRKAY